MLALIILLLSFIGIIWIYYYNKEEIEEEVKETLEAPIEPIPFEAVYKEQIKKTLENPPEIIRVRELIAEFKKDPTKWDNVLAIGDQYRKGSFPRYLPNQDMSMRIFKICAMCPNGEISGIAQSKYIEARTEEIDDEDKAGDKFPESYGNNICELAELSIKTTPWSLFEKPKATKKKEVAPNLIEDLYMPLNINNNNININDGNNYEFEEIFTVPAYRIDNQNVHDHAVVSTTKKNIENIKINNKDYRNEIENVLLETDLSDKEKVDALHVLNKLQDTSHSSYNVSEIEVLSGVWNKVKNNKDHSEILFKQLASGVEHGSVVCSSGKIARIISTLDGIDESITQTRPMWVVREELGNLAARIRNDVPDSLEAAKQFEKEATDQYINKLGFKDTIMNPIISEYSKHI